MKISGHISRTQRFDNTRCTRKGRSKFEKQLNHKIDGQRHKINERHGLYLAKIKTERPEQPVFQGPEVYFRQPFDFGFMYLQETNGVAKIGIWLLFARSVETGTAIALIC